jgi:hypothetical protein
MDFLSIVENSHTDQSNQHKSDGINDWIYNKIPQKES